MKAEGKKREGNRLKVTEWGTFTAFNPRPCLWKHSVEKQRGWLLTSSKHAIRPLAPKNRATSSYRAGETRQPWSAAIKVSLSSFDGSLYRLSNITYISFLWRLFELSNRRNVCTSLVLITFVWYCRKLGQGSRFILTAVPIALTGWSASAENRPLASSVFASWSPLLKPWVC